jgi:acetyl-CoA synthetase
MEDKARRQAKAQSEEVSEAQIAVHWQEEGTFSPPKEFVAQANLADRGVFKRFALEKFPGYYKEFAELLDWYKKWDRIFDGSKPPFWKWFVGGRINASYNCIDRHVEAGRGNKVAYHWIGEPGGTEGTRAYLRVM